MIVASFWAKKKGYKLGNIITTVSYDLSFYGMPTNILLFFCNITFYQIIQNRFPIYLFDLLQLFPSLIDGVFKTCPFVL